MGMKPMSRGTISITSKDPADHPIIDPNYFDTEVDKYVWRTTLRKMAYIVLSREVIAGETPANRFTPPSLDATDEYLDARVKAAAT